MIIITTQKKLKDGASFEVSTLEELAHRLLSIGVIKVTDIKHLASSAGVYGCNGQYFAIVGNYEDTQGILFTFYTSSVYNNFAEYSSINELNIRLKLLTKHIKKHNK